jgi:cell fate regulator YaaT (PSP1 superfamily)
MTPEIVEISFKGNKRTHYFNYKDIPLKPGDYVVVEAEKGIDLGMVSKIGRLVALSEIKGEPKSVIRLAAEDDLDKLKENRLKEVQAFYVAREKIKFHGLNMKLVDVEYQYDQNKLTFYFTSDKRVDFRELVKDLAAKYRTRIELRQIGVRDEARRLGGLGVCGEPLCCTAFIQEFEPISTQYAKDQHLPLNPCKLTGVCGRLKCCLLYEKSFYSATLKKFPALETEINTDRGKAVIDKVDIFREMVYLKYLDDEAVECHSLREVEKILKKQNVNA